MAGKWKEVVRLTTAETHYDQSARPIENLVEVLTHDHHFDQEKFTVLIKR